MLLLLFGFIFAGRAEVLPEVSIASYFVAGMTAAGVLSASFQNLAITIPIERDEGLLKRLRGIPMPKSAYFVGKVFQVICLMLVEVVLLLLIGVVLFGVRLPDSAQKWGVLAGMLVVGVAACTLLGIAFSSVPKTGSSAPAIVTPVALILQFISGVYFVFSQIPGWLQTIASIFPLKWMAQGLRYVFLPDQAKAVEVGGQWQRGLVFAVLAGWTVVGLVLCVTTFRWRTAADG